MTVTIDNILVTINAKPHGWYEATSSEMPGLYISESSMKKTIAASQAVIKALTEYRKT